ncbi:MAG: DNA alkylation repair protein [Candidatus Omnitrophota bacterium]
MMLIKKLRKDLKKHANKEKAKILQSFFKTGPGEYGHGDKFIGVVVPSVRKIAQQYIDADLKSVLELLKSAIHEERLLALIILILQYEKGDNFKKKVIFTIYLKYTRYINNWDLVDLTAGRIIGDYLLKKDKTILFKLARSIDLWERRISIIASFAFIRNGQFTQTLKISRILLKDKEDLIHKAVGWMLREIGKRDIESEEFFLRKEYKKMPRTMLRYAIERFSEQKRQAYLKGTV